MIWVKFWLSGSQNPNCSHKLSLVWVTWSWCYILARQYSAINSWRLSAPHYPFYGTAPVRHRSRTAAAGTWDVVQVLLTVRNFTTIIAFFVINAPMMIRISAQCVIHTSSLWGRGGLDRGMGRAQRFTRCLGRNLVLLDVNIDLSVTIFSQQILSILWEKRKRLGWAVRAPSVGLL